MRSRCRYVVVCILMALLLGWGGAGIPRAGPVGLAALSLFERASVARGQLAESCSQAPTVPSGTSHSQALRLITEASTAQVCMGVQEGVPLLPVATPLKPLIEDLLWQRIYEFLLSPSSDAIVLAPRGWGPCWRTAYHVDWDVGGLSEYLLLQDLLVALDEDSQALVAHGRAVPTPELTPEARQAAGRLLAADGLQFGAVDAALREPSALLRLRFSPSIRLQLAPVPLDQGNCLYTVDVLGYDIPVARPVDPSDEERAEMVVRYRAFLEAHGPSAAHTSAGAQLVGSVQLEPGAMSLTDLAARSAAITGIPVVVDPEVAHTQVMFSAGRWPVAQAWDAATLATFTSLIGQDGALALRPAEMSLPAYIAAQVELGDDRLPTGFSAADFLHSAPQRVGDLAQEARTWVKERYALSGHGIVPSDDDRLLLVPRVEVVLDAWAAMVPARADSAAAPGDIHHELLGQERVLVTWLWERLPW